MIEPQPAGPSSRIIHFAAGLAFCLAVLTVLAVLETSVLRASWRLLEDQPHSEFGSIYGQSAAFVQGQRVLAPRWSHSPFTALAFLGLGHMHRDWAAAVWLFLQLSALVFLMRECARVAKPLPRWPRVALAVCVPLTSFPVLACITSGSLSLWVFVLAMYALTRPHRGMHWLGAAAALKFYPLFYALPHLLRARHKELATLSLWSVGLGLVLPWWIFEREVFAKLLSRLWVVVSHASDPVFDTNQTMRAVLARLFISRSIFDQTPNPVLFRLPAELVLLLAVGITFAMLAMTVWKNRARTLHDATAFAALVTAITMVIEPGSAHHFVVLPFAQMVLFGQARTRMQAALATASMALCGGMVALGLGATSMIGPLLMFGTLTLASSLVLAGLWTLRPTAIAPAPAVTS